MGQGSPPGRPQGRLTARGGHLLLHPLLFGLLVVLLHVEIDRQRPSRQHQRDQVDEEKFGIVVLLGDRLGLKGLFGFLVFGGSHSRRCGESRGDEQQNELLHSSPL
jgi:hypothetical protein